MLPEASSVLNEVFTKAISHYTNAKCAYGNYGNDNFNDNQTESVLFREIRIIINKNLLGIKRKLLINFRQLKFSKMK